MAPRNRYHRMSLSLRAYSDRSSDEEADGFRRRFREIISNAIEVTSGLLVSWSRDNMMASEVVVSDVQFYASESLTIDEGSQDVQGFDKPVSWTRQGLHESRRRLHGRSRESLGKQKVIHR